MSNTGHRTSNDLENLSIHAEYDGTDEIQIANGSVLPITHYGISKFDTSSRSFILFYMIFVPGAARNLISVHQFTKANNVSLEFFPNYFLVKDQITGAVFIS